MRNDEDRANSNRDGISESRNDKKLDDISQRSESTMRTDGDRVNSNRVPEIKKGLDDISQSSESYFK